MKFRELYVSQNYYRVVVDENTGDGAIAVMITGFAWKEVFFRLTNEELSAASTDQHALDDLAERLAADKGKHLYAERLLGTRLERIS